VADGDGTLALVENPIGAAGRLAPNQVLLTAVRTGVDNASPTGTDSNIVIPKSVATILRIEINPRYLNESNFPATILLNFAEFSGLLGNN